MKKNKFVLIAGAVLALALVAWFILSRPSTLNDQKTSSLQSGTAVISWSAPVEENVLGYKLYYRTEDSAEETVLDIGLPPAKDGTLTYEATGLTVSKTYVFSLRAYDKDGTESDPTTVTKTIEAQN
jgi:hypothetical protein